MTISVQPTEDIHLNFDAKVPDKAQELNKVEILFRTHAAFSGKPLPDA